MSEDSDDWVPELLESQLHGIDPENDIKEKDIQEPIVSRGSRALPLMWSKVISISEDGDFDISIQSI